MAKLRLSRRRVEEGALPPTCMCCGAPADVVKDKTFSWHPEWIDWFILLGCIPPFVFLFAGIFLAFLNRRRLRVAVPLCQKHQNHWRWRMQVIATGLVLVVLVAIVVVVLLMEGRRLPFSWRNVAGPVPLFGIGLFITWLVTAGVLQNTAIRAREITDRGITLTKVAPAFLWSLEEQRREEKSYQDFDEELEEEQEAIKIRDLRVRTSRSANRDSLSEEYDVPEPE